MMKKPIALSLIISLLCMMFCACTSQTPITDYSKDTASTDNESSTAEPVETSVTESDTESAAESETESETVSEAEPASESKAESEAESQSESDESQEPKTYRIVALGDSITAGYGLSDASTERYTSLLETALAAEYGDVVIDNYAVSGYTSTDVLNHLNGGRAKTLADADAVIICIGANNVLQPLGAIAFSYFAKCQTSITGMIKAFLTGGDVSQYMGTVSSTLDALAADLVSDQTNAKRQNGVNQLNTDIKLIIEAIRKENADCVIYYGNIYNPYKYFDLSLFPSDFDFVQFSDGVVCELNQVIADNAKALGYTVVDVYIAFEQHDGRLVNAVCNPTAAQFNYDPHPNKEGHIYLAQIYKGVFDKELAK